MWTIRVSAWRELPDQDYSLPQQPRQAASALDAIIPTSPLSAISCYAGILSIICCFFGPLLGPLVIVLGVQGLETWTAKASAYGATTSRIRAWIGIVTGSLGTMSGIVTRIMYITRNQV